MSDNGKIYVEYMALQDLLARRHPENPKAHDIGRLIESFEIFGYVSLGAIDELTGLFLCGHGRTEALEVMKRDPELKAPGRIDVREDDWYVPTNRGVKFKDALQVKAYLVADNELTLLGGWDEPQLATLLQEIGAQDKQLLETVYTGDKLDELLRDLQMQDEPPEDKGAQVDRAAELQEKWQVNRGDVWIIPSVSGDGNHRILCGDSTCADDVALLMDGVKMQGVFTSPPYAEQRKKQYGGTPTDEYVEWWDGVQSCVRDVLKDDGSFFVSIKPHCEDGERALYVFDLVLAMKRSWGWMFIDEFCWTRIGVPKRVKYRFKNAFEPIYQFAIIQDFKFRPNQVQYDSFNVPIPGGEGVGDTNWAKLQGQGDLFGGRESAPGKAYPSNLIKPFSNDLSRGHPAAFAAQLVEFFIKAYSDEADCWYDPFLGSGTTIVAAEQIKRIGYGIEIAPEYVSVSLQRLSDLGLTPERQT